VMRRIGKTRETRRGAPFSAITHLFTLYYA